MVLHKINIVEGTEGVAVGEVIAEILSDDEHADAETTSTTHEENLSLLNLLNRQIKQANFSCKPSYTTKIRIIGRAKSWQYICLS